MIKIRFSGVIKYLFSKSQLFSSWICVAKEIYHKLPCQESILKTSEIFQELVQCILTFSCCFLYILLLFYHDQASWLVFPDSFSNISLIQVNVNLAGLLALEDGNLIEDVSKLVKILSLDKVLKTARRCSLSKNRRPGLTSLKKIITNCSCSYACFDKLSDLTKERT